jgi:hypothetical protein
MKIFVHISSGPALPIFGDFLDSVPLVSYCGELGAAPPIEPAQVKGMTAMEMELLPVCPVCLLRMMLSSCRL